jgi:tetratricopeptide (TPR) repeat protein
MNTKLKLALVVVLLAACVYAAYWNAPQGEFIWDDINLILLDYQIKSWNFLGDVFTRDFFGFSDDNRKYGYYRPIVTISYTLDWHLYEDDPAGYHWTNILIHFGCTLLLFGIFYRLLRRQWLAPTIAAALFAVHPIHTESVTWIAGRTDPLCALFLLAAMLLFMVHAERLAARHGYRLPPGTSPNAARQHPWWLLAPMTVLFAFSILAKEMAITLPLISVAYVVLFITGVRDWRRFARFLPAIGLQIGVVTAYFLYRYLKISFSTQAKDPFESITAILSFLKTIGYYTLKILVPVHLSAYIQNPLVESVLDPAFIAGFLLTALLLGAVVLCYRRAPLVSFTVLFYLITLGPLSNFIRISGPKDMGFMTAERFIYIPSAAVILLIGVGLAHLIGRLGSWRAEPAWANGGWRRVVALAVAAALVGSYAALSVRRNEDWRSNEKLFTKMIADAPNATLLYVVLGNIYRLNKKYELAEKILNKALEYIAPRDREEPAWIYNDLAGIYAEQRRFDEALQLMKLASRTRLHNSAVLYNYGEIYRAMGDCRTAVEYYQRSLLIYRDNRNAFIKMGQCFQQRENYELSNKAFVAALNLTPHDASLFSQIGYNYLRMGNLTKADFYLGQALKEKPRHIKARLNLAQLRFRQGKLDEATGLLEQLLAENERNADAHAMLGYILGHADRKPEAGPHIQRALELNRKHEQARLTLATLNIDKSPNKARVILDGLLKDNPENVEATFAMGLACLAEKNVMEAATWFQKTLKINPKHAGATKELEALGLPTKVEEPPPVPIDD